MKTIMTKGRVPLITRGDLKNIASNFLKILDENNLTSLKQIIEFADNAKPGYSIDDTDITMNLSNILYASDELEWIEITKLEADYKKNVFDRYRLSYIIHGSGIPLEVVIYLAPNLTHFQIKTVDEIKDLGSQKRNLPFKSEDLFGNTYYEKVIKSVKYSDIRRELENLAK